MQRGQQVKKGLASKNSTDDANYLCLVCGENFDALEYSAFCATCGPTKTVPNSLTLYIIIVTIAGSRTR